MNVERTEISTIKGYRSNFGMILVLFILLVIMTTLVYSSTGGDNQSDDSLTTIQASKGFNIYNQTAYFSLVTTALEGNFESPFPASHIILPYRSYHFEVNRALPYKDSDAYATYAVKLESETVGSIKIRMRVAGALEVFPETRIEYINGPIVYDKGNTYVTIRNA
ncbi:hypothetical protein [Paenibacillus herberti]|uniref:Uncharacterized protein n=1 Tax=Paenibacillus herberti TaxID=1619309 RepID=A0A229P2N0_9BACL|nr:hypothetical protein [Paenibacillus herberti]OXM16492.1 hypothetical protein CGZ75_07410 [Paenibacillus herberti]